MTKIYGASDDLIEIDGDISDEFGCYNGRKKTIETSLGTKAKIHYGDEGCWKIELISKGSDFIELIETTGDGHKHTEKNALNCTGYSDVLVLDYPEWIKVGNKVIH